MIAYNIFGLRLAVCADAPVVEAVRARLHRFPEDTCHRDPDLLVEFVTVPNDCGHAVDETTAGRLVYESPIGQVRYVPAKDRLFVDVGGRARMQCDVGQAHARISVVGDAPEHMWLASEPLLTLALTECLKRRDRFSLHAAAVAFEGNGLLLAGPRGAGKSTLSIALSLAGLDFVSDDLIVLFDRPEGLAVLGFPDDINATAETASIFPGACSAVSALPRAGRPKLRLHPVDVCGDRVVSECTPRVLVVPRVGRSGASTLTPIARDEALLELVPNVLLTERRSSQAHLNAIGRLVETVGCYRLETGRDFAALSRDMRNLLV